MGAIAARRTVRIIRKLFSCDIDIIRIPYCVLKLFFKTAVRNLVKKLFAIAAAVKNIDDIGSDFGKNNIIKVGRYTCFFIIICAHTNNFTGRITVGYKCIGYFSPIRFSIKRFLQECLTIRLVGNSRRIKITLALCAVPKRKLICCIRFKFRSIAHHTAHIRKA